MRIGVAFGVKAIMGLLAAGLCSAAAFAFDAKHMDENFSPGEAFRFGFNAYKQGDKSTAVEALTYAADKGHAIAQWKLGRMYAEGDGLKKDDSKAFKLFSEIVNVHGEDNPNAPSARFVSNAFVELGGYYRNGIPGSDMAPDLGRARSMYAYAASYFGDPDAQLALARMYYDGEGVERDPLQAARWAKLAADKGNVGAQALLGHMLFEGEGIERQPVLGLMFLSLARDRAPGQDWILRMHEQAFSVADETERRTALALAEKWETKNASAQ